MSELLPNSTTVGDICTAALFESGAFGTGQTPSATDTNQAWSRLQWMLQEWERKRWLVYHLVDLSVVSTGATFYTVGPGGQISTGGASTVRPAKVESAFLRQITQSQPNQIDYPMILLQSMEDYSKIGLKGLVAFPSYCFYDSGWPLGKLYFWPVPNANIYELHIQVLEQLPSSFATLAVAFSLPLEYYSAMLYNLALRLRSKYSIPTYPGDMLPGLAKNSLNVLRGANTQIARLRIPNDLVRPGIYNIYSDQDY